MNENNFNICIGKILAGRSLNEDDAHAFKEAIDGLQNMLDEGDQDDYFGTEGWRHRMGWD